MLLSFVVYTGLALILSFLGWHISQRESHIIRNGGKELPFYSWEILVSLLLFAIVSGARYKTGYDHHMYLSQYVQLRDFGGFSRIDSYEPGFILISRLFALIKAHSFYYFAFWAVLQLGFVVFAFQDRKYLLVWLPFVLVLGGYYINWMNTIRQVVVECCFIAMIPLLHSRKNLSILFILTLILSSIHKSAYLIFLYSVLVIVLNKVTFKRSYCFVIFLVCIVLGAFPEWLKVFLFIPKILTNLGYEKYNEMLIQIIDGGFRSLNWGPSRLLSLMLSCIIIFYAPVLIEKYTKDRLIQSYFVMAFIGMCLDNLFINTSHFVLRPLEYATIFSIPMLSYVLHYLYENKLKIQFLVVMIIVSLPIYVAIYKATYRPTPEILPYLYNIIFLQ